MQYRYFVIDPANQRITEAPSLPKAEYAAWEMGTGKAKYDTAPKNWGKVYGTINNSAEAWTWMEPPRKARALLNLTTEDGHGRDSITLNGPSVLLVKASRPEANVEALEERVFWLAE